MTFRLTLATPDKVFFDGLADAAVCPGVKGQFGILAQHAHMMTALTIGIVKISGEGREDYFVVDGGMAGVDPEHVELLADAVIPAKDAVDAEQKLEELKAAKPRLRLTLALR